MADVELEVAGQPRKRTFNKFSFRGVDLDALLDMSTDDLVKLRGLKRKPMVLIKKLRKANSGGGSRYDISRHHPEVKVHGSLSWGKRKSQTMPSREDSVIISTAVSSINKFANDGSFMQKVTPEQNDSYESKLESQLASSESSGILAEGLSAKQLAAKALQLSLKGKHEEANRIMKEVENIKAEQVAGDESSRPQKESDA